MAKGFPKGRVSFRGLVTALVLLVIVCTSVVLAKHLLSDSGCASPPTEKERGLIQSFVKTHLPDATGFEWTIEDCDENGLAVSDFTTRRRGSVASRVFLADPACRPSIEPDADPGDVTCTTAGLTFSIYFEDKGGIDTDVELAIEST